MAEPMRMPQWLRLSALIAIACLIGVACTSGDSGNDATTGNATPPALSPLVAGGGGAIELPNTESRPFSQSSDCKTCHPRQFEEWRTSPHAYSGISPSFYSLVQAGQNSFGAGLLANMPGGVSQGGGVGSFCLPCHSPIAFTGDGQYGGNNSGFANVQPDASIPFICSPGAPMNALQECTPDTSSAICGAAGMCSTFEGRTCGNMPPVTPGTLFPRQMRHCGSDAECPGAAAGSCVINPATIFYSERGQEGINCETCHNALPNHNRACQLYRNSDSAGVLALDLAERGSAQNVAGTGGRRLRLGPYPLDGMKNDVVNDGLANDQLALVTNAFHESARVDSPLAIPYQDTDRPNGVVNPINNNPQIVRPTALTCADLPYCGNAGVPGGQSVCNGGSVAVIGNMCGSDFDCGGCGMFDPNTGQGTCGAASPFVGNACITSNDCNAPADPTKNMLELATDLATGDRTLGPLAARPHDAVGNPGNELDRSDGNYYRSSMYCGTCHDVRPPFANATLRSCQLQDTHVCSTDLDCRGLNIGCPLTGPGGTEDCGPCVAENNAAPTLVDGSAPQNLSVAATGIDPRNNGYRRVENLFSEWQISAYAHPELRFCEDNAFKACTTDADCILPGTGENEGPCSVESPLGFGGEVVTCQDCHMSNFPETPLVQYTVVNPTDIYDNPGVLDATTLSPVPLANKNALYSTDKAAVEGSQSDSSQPLPMRRVSTHFMSGVDLPLVRYPGQGVQAVRRQQLVDSGFKIVVENPRNLTTPATPISAGDKVRVDIEVENVGVGHRYPAGFSHERQNWVQLYVTDKQTLQNLGNIDPFAANAPCNLQKRVARSATDMRDPVGAAELETAGCVYRSGFVLDKAHPETGEMVPDGSLLDEDPEDFFVVVGTRMRGDLGSQRVEQNPGAEGRALSISNICAEATAVAYRNAVAAGSGLDLRVGAGSAFEIRSCDASRSPSVPGEGFRPPGGSLTSQPLGSGVTAPGFGNPDCMTAGEDLGPCVPEIELSDGNERGRCAGDLTRGTCQSDSECADEGPCLFRCSGFPELMCCDQADPACATYYAGLEMNECFIGTEGVCSAGSTNAGSACFGDGKCNGGTCDLEGTCIGGPTPEALCASDGSCGIGGRCGDVAICIGGARSGLGCDVDGDCGVGHSCGSVGQCNVENAGIVNFQGQFRSTDNGVCVNLADPRDAEGAPKPILVAGQPVSCFLDLTCTLSGLPNGTTGCLINGQCAENSADGVTSFAGDACTNYTYRDDCGLDGAGDSISCNTQFNLELNGRPSESVFIQNHPYNFNSLPPFEPRVFEYEFDVPAAFAGRELVISARIMNRQFPMRFLRNLVGTQTVNPPLVVEAQGDATNLNECNNTRQIDIDCYVRPLAILGNAEPGGFVPAEQFTRTKTFPVVP